MLQVFVFASFLCDIVASSLPLKLNILDTPQGKIEYLKIEKKLNQMKN